MYMGIAMTTSSQACTVPALHWDMGVVLASSTCCRRSSWSSDPSDRLRLRRVGLERLSESEWVDEGRRGKGEGEGEVHVGDVVEGVHLGRGGREQSEQRQKTKR